MTKLTPFDELKAALLENDAPGENPAPQGEPGRIDCSQSLLLIGCLEHVFSLQVERASHAICVPRVPAELVTGTTDTQR